VKKVEGLVILRLLLLQPKDLGEPRDASRFLRRINRASGELPYMPSHLSDQNSQEGRS